MLELDGLVIMVPRKGAQVAQITEKDLNDVLEVRLGLEELAVKLACQRITESELQKLYQASRRFDLPGDEQRAPDSAAEQSAGANVPLPD